MSKKIDKQLTIPNQQFYQDVCWYFYTYIRQTLSALDSIDFLYTEIDLGNNKTTNKFNNIIAIKIYLNLN